MDDCSNECYSILHYEGSRRQSPIYCYDFTKMSLVLHTILYIEMIKAHQHWIIEEVEKLHFLVDCLYHCIRNSSYVRKKVGR